MQLLRWTLVPKCDDSLVYSFLQFDGGAATDAGANPAPPPYNSIVIFLLFLAKTHGANATINPQTGLYQVSLRAGKYVANVCISEPEMVSYNA
jgi:hypothetical protein